MGPRRLRHRLRWRCPATCRRRQASSRWPGTTMRGGIEGQGPRACRLALKASRCFMISCDFPFEMSFLMLLGSRPAPFWLIRTCGPACRGCGAIERSTRSTGRASRWSLAESVGRCCRIRAFFALRSRIWRASYRPWPPGGSGSLHLVLGGGPQEADPLGSHSDTHVGRNFCR